MHWQHDGWDSTQGLPLKAKEYDILELSGMPGSRNPGIWKCGFRGNPCRLMPVQLCNEVQHISAQCRVAQCRPV